MVRNHGFSYRFLPLSYRLLLPFLRSPMPDTQKEPSIYAFKYWPTWIGMGLLRLLILLPWTWRMAFGRGLGRLVLRITPRRARISRINVDLCFPELSERERADLVRAHAESMGMGAMDFVTAWWAADKEFPGLVDIHGREHVDAAFANGHGLIFLTAHFTSIEVSGWATTKLGSISPMYRPNENPVIQHIMLNAREKHVENAIPRDDVRTMLRTLRANKGVWFAPDQNFGHKHSVFSPFFGIPAATNTATCRFAQMTGAQVVPFFALRREDRPGYDVYIEPALEDFPSGDIQKDTDRINRIFERWIRQAPAQYLWSHRRFKDRPNDEPRFY